MVVFRDGDQIVPYAPSAVTTAARTLDASRSSVASFAPVPGPETSANQVDKQIMEDIAHSEL
jgi:hypothetical protein